jgi:hypothetical protein
MCENHFPTTIFRRKVRSGGDECSAPAPGRYVTGVAKGQNGDLTATRGPAGRSCASVSRKSRF